MPVEFVKKEEEKRPQLIYDDLEFCWRCSNCRESMGLLGVLLFVLHKCRK